MFRSVARLVSLAVLLSLALPGRADGADRVDVAVSAFPTLNSFTFSPDGNGRFDTLAMQISIEDQVSEPTASWTIVDSGGNAMLPQPVPIDLTGWPQLVEFEVDPLSQGVELAHGFYSLEIEVTAVDMGVTYWGHWSHNLGVDLTPPVVTSIEPLLDVFYPKEDHGMIEYRNTVRAIVKSAAWFHYGRMDVVNSQNQVVRTGTTYSWGVDRRFEWDGRDNEGNFAPAGRYRLVAVAEDDFGNVARTASAWFGLSHSSYIKRKAVARLSARATLVRNYSGACGKLSKPGRRGGRGSLGYYSEAKCASKQNIRRGMAIGLHGVILPTTAVRYRWLKVRVKGGAVQPRNRAAFFLLDRRGKRVMSVRAMSPKWRWHNGANTTSSGYVSVERRELYWVVNTAYAQRYDVAKFFIRVDYYKWNGSEPAPYGRAGGSANTPDSDQITPIAAGLHSGGLTGASGPGGPLSVTLAQ